MFSVAKNGMITMDAGDSFEVPLFINRGSLTSPVRYKLRAHDTVFFSVSEPNQDFTEALIRKCFTKKNLNKDGNVVIILDSTDTEYVVSGQYYYEIKIRLGNGKIETIAPRRKFIIN